MKQYLVLYRWYESTSYGIIKAEDKNTAILKFAKYVYNLNNNYNLEKKYGYCSGISPFFYDEDKKETFEEQFNEFLESEECGAFEITEINQDTEGIITSISRNNTLGFYNGEEN